MARLVQIATAIRAKGAAGRPERAGVAVACAEANASRCCADSRSSAGYPPQQPQWSPWKARAPARYHPPTRRGARGIRSHPVCCCSHTGSPPRLLRCRLLRCRLLRHRPATWRTWCTSRAAAASQLDFRRRDRDQPPLQVGVPPRADWITQVDNRVAGRPATGLVTMGLYARADRDRPAIPIPRNPTRWRMPSPITPCGGASPGSHPPFLLRRWCARARALLRSLS